MIKLTAVIGNRGKIKKMLASSFKIKQYGEVRFKNDSSSRENDRSQDYVISESQIAYDTDYTHENWVLRSENAASWYDFF